MWQTQIEGLRAKLMRINIWQQAGLVSQPLRHIVVDSIALRMPASKVLSLFSELDLTNRTMPSKTRATGVVN